ncbi:MAG: DUF420 domain-containing protein [Alicyclobacillaceae bacterium]|nr:DUF420 domain-containing protein [Alicyclobacillaceae bacterium]
MIATVLPYINEAFILLSAGCVAVGWILIRRGRVEAHRRAMLAGVVLASAFFVSYLLKTLTVGDATFGGPERWRGAYQVFLQVHSVLATVAAVLGVLTLRAAAKGRRAFHKRIGRWTASLWFVTAATGLAVFLLLYILYEPGPTKNMFRAWLGRF